MSVLRRGTKVLVSYNALSKAKREYNVVVSPTGKVVSNDGNLVTVLHDGGEKVDWSPRSLSIVKD